MPSRPQRPNRRAACAWLAATAAWCATGCAAPRAGAASRERAALATQPRALEIASGVYMLAGASGEPDIANLGRVGNAGFIVGPSGVMAIDTGTSHRHGSELLDAIGRVTRQPVKLALITHTRQEFLFGAAAFRERGIPVAMQRHAATLMASRCETCLKALRQLLGDEAMRGTETFKADRLFDEGHTISNVRSDTYTGTSADNIGRPVQVLYFGHSSGPGDIGVFDPTTGTLFAGGLVDCLRIPDVGDSDLPGWRQALRALHALPIKRLVPGHGPASDASAIDAVDRYLAQLEARARELVRDDVALSDVPDALALADFATWAQYDTVHRRNAAIVFLRVEREQLFK